MANFYFGSTVNYIHWNFVANMLTYTTEDARNLLHVLLMEEYGMKEKSPRYVNFFADFFSFIQNRNDWTCPERLLITRIYLIICIFTVGPSASTKWRWRTLQPTRSSINTWRKRPKQTYVSKNSWFNVKNILKIIKRFGRF